MDEQILLDIIALEWDMFSAVNSAGGKAACQEDYQTFKIMRLSQAEAWSEEVLHSYRRDLQQAKSEGRNLMSEKYARMMESTFPTEYERIAGLLPAVDSRALHCIEKIIAIHLMWKVETADKYPNLTKKGRVIYTQDDSCCSTSFETYLRGELKTYAPETILLYYGMTLAYAARGENMEEVYLRNTVKQYGYASLEEAERLAG